MTAMAFILEEPASRGLSDAYAHLTSSLWKITLAARE